MELNLKANNEKVIGLYPRGPDTVLIVTTNNHYLIERSKEEVWRVKDADIK